VEAALTGRGGFGPAQVFPSIFAAELYLTGMDDE
jgi:hypothetical protein